MHDIRYALRVLSRTRLFTVTVVLVIGIGIGAATTIFSVVNAVLLRPLPFRDPARLVQIAEKNDALHLSAFGASALNYLAWKERQQSFARIGAVGFGTYTLTGRGDPETYTGNAITPSLLPLLGLQPIVGRAFADGEDKPGAAPVALISESLWRRRFGADPSIVGQPATLNGIAYTVVGVAPPALPVLTTGDVWVPLVIDPPKEIRLNHVLFVVGRLHDGVTLQRAQTEMNGIAEDMSRQYPEMHDWGVNIITFTDTFVSSQLRTALLVLLGAVGFLLIIVSANVANLLLSRAIERRREMAVRSALGAARGRLLRQMLVESLILSGAGGLVGVATAAWGVSVLHATLPPNLLPVPDIGVDRIVLLFAAGVTMVTGVTFGIVPAWQAARTDVNATLKDAGRSASGGMRPLLRRALAGAELALATILLIGAALLVRSLLQLQRVPLGFDPAGVTAFQLSLPPTKYDMVRRVAFYRDLRPELAAIPGVASVGLSSGIPFGVGNFTTSPFAAPGSAALPAPASVPVDWRTVSPGYFGTVKIPLLRGRDFTDSDTAEAPKVMIVSRAAARTFWGDADPIGRVVRRVADKADFTVVGVVGDVRSTTLARESPAVYYSSGTRTWPLMDVVFRPTADSAGAMTAIRRKIHDLDPDLPISNVRPMAEWISTGAAQPRLNATLLGVFAAVALLVAAIGTYGVLAYSVSQRTKELGLRMALGSDRQAVLQLIVREGMAVGLAGIAAGTAAALLLSRALSALVYGVSIHDPFTYLEVTIVLAFVALVACVVPAVRASRVDPMVALRLD
ncbi:MAG TPA: ABC transporter permease [Vicinamibacterales bacterium]|nr:ABC transporter permease [Vicinamibacterales bacterium]